jgi:hypothetical protein
MAERLVNEFTVNRPIDEAWPIICDVERIAPCLPGAQLEEIEGEIYRGNVKVKLGAVATHFQGEAHFVERDDTAHRAVLKASGRDKGGRGNASADIEAQAEALSPTSTRCVVTADLHITGKVAQFGRGILGDVSKKLMGQFATNLNTMLDEQPAAAAPTEPPAAEVIDAPASPEGSTAPVGDTGAAATQSDTPTIRKIEGPASEPIDMAGLAGPALLKRVAPIVLAVLVVLLVLRRRR